MPGPFTSPVAQSVPFEPNRNPQYGGNAGPSDIQSTNVQDAIEEAKADALANDRFMLLCSYGGNSNIGRYLEFFAGQASDISPIYLTAQTRLLAVTLQTSAANANCTLGFFDLNVSNTVPVYSISLNGKRIQQNGTTLATFAAGALMAVRVTAGSINQPTMQITFSAST